MFQPFGKELHEILGDDRLKMLNNSAACAQLLQDKSSLTERENELLISILTSSIANKLREATWRKNIEISSIDINTFLKEVEKQGYNEDEFRWAITAWAEALDVACKFKTKKKAPVRKKETKPKTTNLLASLSYLFSILFTKKNGRIKHKPTPDVTEKISESLQETDTPHPEAESPGQINPAAETMDTQQAAASESGSEGTSSKEWWDTIQEAETSIKKEDAGERFSPGGLHPHPGKKPVPGHTGSNQRKYSPDDHKITRAGFIQKIKDKKILWAAGVLLVAAIALWGVLTMVHQPAELAVSSPQTESTEIHPVVTDEKQEPAKGSAEDEKKQPASDNNSGESVGSAGTSPTLEPNPAPADPPPVESVSDDQRGGDKQPGPESSSSGDDRKPTDVDSPGQTIPEPAVTPPPVPDQLGKDLPSAEEILKELQQVKQTDELFRKLAEYKSMQVLGFGEKRDFSSSEGSYVFICTRQQVKDVYHVKNNMFHSLSTGQQYADITSGLEKGEKDLWVQFAK